MKRKSYITVFLMFVFVSAICADYRADVTTPKGSQVEAWIMDEVSLPVRMSSDANFSSIYPNAQLLTTYDNVSSTRRFNCHGYAWYMTELSNPLTSPRWIGYYATTDEDIYMTDGSYVQVPNEGYPGKVSYASDDHSAITTSQPGWFISKWGQTLLCKHQWNDTPYDDSELKYYVPAAIPKINGVNIYTFQPPGTLPSTFEKSASGTITALPGQLVKLEARVNYDSPTIGFATYFNFQTNLQGAVFTDNTSSIIVTGAGPGNKFQTAMKSFIMPASGSVNWSGTLVIYGDGNVILNFANLRVN